MGSGLPVALWRYGLCGDSINGSIASKRSACAGLLTLMGCSLELDFGTQVSTVNIPGKFELPTLSNS